MASDGGFGGKRCTIQGNSCIGGSNAGIQCWHVLDWQLSQSLVQSASLTGGMNIHFRVVISSPLQSHKAQSADNRFAHNAFLRVDCSRTVVAHAFLLQKDITILTSVPYTLIYDCGSELAGYPRWLVVAGQSSIGPC